MAGKSSRQKKESVAAPSTKAAQRRRTATYGLGILLTIAAIAFVMRSEIVNSGARVNLSERRFDATMWWLELGNRLYANNAESEFLWARLSRKQANVQAMGEHLRNAEQLGYSAERIEREKWLAFAQAGEMGEAEPHLSELLRDQRGDGREICEAYVLGYLSAYRLHDANALLEAWIEGFPNDAQAFYVRATVAQNSSDWKSAEQDLRQAIQHDPNHMPARLALGEVLLKAKRPDEAIEHFEFASADEKVRADATTGLAICLHRLRQTERARVILEEVLAINKCDTEAIRELASIEIESGSYQKAYDLLKPVAKQRPLNADLQNLYATALRGIGKREEAREEFALVRKAKDELDRADKLKNELLNRPNDIELRFEIAQIYMQYSTEHEGLIWYWSILDIDAEHRPTHLALAEHYENKTPASDSDRRNAEYYRKKCGSS